MSVVTGPYGYSLEADVRIFDNVASTEYGKGRSNGSSAPGVIVGPDVGEESMLDALCKGVWACVASDADRKTLEDVLIRVARGECLLLGDIGRSTVAAKNLVTKLTENGNSASAANGASATTGANPFSERERQIITGIAEGLTSPVIAGVLGLSVQTVKNYVTGILTKTGTRKRAHAVAVASERGWLDSASARTRGAG